MMRYLLLFGLILGCFSHLYGAPVQEETFSLVIADFEQPGDDAKFVPMRDNTQKMTRTTDPKLVISGKGSGVWYVPKEGSGEHQWPRVTLTLPPEKQDWDMFDQVEVEIFNPLDTEARFSFNAIDGDGRRYTPYTQPVPPGRSTFRWTFDEKLRGNPIKQFMVVTGHPQREYTLYLDDIRITTNRTLFNKRLERLLERTEADWQRSEWRRAGMENVLDNFRKRIRNIADSRGKLGQQLKDFTRLSQEYESAKTALIAKLVAMGEEEFAKAFPGQAVWGYGWTDAAQKVYRKDLPYQGKIGGTAKVALAGRESEAFQIVLRSRKALDKVKLALGELKTASGEVLPPSAVKVSTVGHVKTKKPGYKVDPAEWRPDVLLDYLEEIPLEADVWQAFYLEVTASADVKPGLYKGIATATAANAPALSIPVQVRIWDFKLPEKLTQPVLVNFNSDSNHLIFTDNKGIYKEFNAFREGALPYEKLSAESKRLWELELKVRDLMLEHKMAPNGLYVTRRRHKIEEVLDWDARGASYYNISYVPPQPVAKGEGYPDWARNVVMNNLKALVPELRKHNMMEQAYLYSFDEIKDEKFFSAKQILGEIKEKYPDVKTITTTEDRDFGRTNGLDKVVDCWCPQVERFVEQLDLVREVQRSGKKVFYYSCMWDPGMDMLIEKPLTAPRLLLGLNQFKYGSDGFLYYGVNAGQRNNVLIKTKTPLTEHDGRSFEVYNGCGLLIYATDHGPMPSIRLKAFRDGMEDMEYCHLLAKLPAEKMSSGDVKALRSLLNISEDIIKDLEIYDQTGEKLGAWRSKAGALLERYSTMLPKGGAIRTVSTAAAPAAVEQEIKVELKLDAKTWCIRNVGQKAVFELQANEDGKPAGNGKVTVSTLNSYGRELEKIQVDFAKQNPAKLELAMDEPGIMQIVTSNYSSRGKTAAAKYPVAAVAFSPDKIQPAAPEPPDFMDFWNKGLQEVKDAPVEATPFNGKKYKDHESWMITVSMPGNEKSYALMLLPKAPGKYPVEVSIPGAGPGTGELWTGDREKNLILVSMHVHKYPIMADRKAMTAAREEYEKKAGCGYMYENAGDRDKYFYRRAFLGMSRILDYIKTREEWDGKNIVVTGSSQGGASALALACLNPSVTVVTANVPALCDHFGGKAGRRPGWPQFSNENAPGYEKTAPYFDGCNFAAHIEAPVFMGVGFLDQTAPAAGGYAAFNRIPGIKEMYPMDKEGHSIPVWYINRSRDFIKKHIK